MEKRETTKGFFATSKFFTFSLTDSRKRGLSITQDTGAMRKVKAQGEFIVMVVVGRAWKFSGSQSLELPASRQTSSLVPRQPGYRRMMNQEAS
jgi:hypothetical protein